MHARLKDLKEHLVFGISRGSEQRPVGHASATRIGPRRPCREHDAVCLLGHAFLEPSRLGNGLTLERS